MDVRSAVHPCYRGSHRRLDLPDDERDAVHEQNHVEAAAVSGGREDPLVRDHVVVVCGVVEVYEPDLSVLTPLTEGHGLLAPQPAREQLVGPHQPLTLHREEDGPEPVENLVGAVRVGGDLRVQTDQGFPHHRLDQHV